MVGQGSTMNFTRLDLTTGLIMTSLVTKLYLKVIELVLAKKKLLNWIKTIKTIKNL